MKLAYAAMTAMTAMTDWLIHAWRTLFAPTPDGCCPGCWQKEWRPAVLNTDPHRVCDKCSYAERLTNEEFYAQFGRMPYEYLGGVWK